MAYNVHVSCDCCGEELFATTNQTVSITRAEQIAKKRGWKTTKTGGWYCKDCLWKITPPPERPDRENL